jgi:hypothetical protein
MARPTTNSLNYFNTDVVDDDNLQYVEAIHKLEGYAIVHKLWKHIYGGPDGYYRPFSDMNQRLFCKNNNISLDTLKAVLDTCFEPDVNIFSKAMFDQFKILTSRGVQKRWKRIVTDSGRKNNQISAEYCLICEETTVELELSGGKTGEKRNGNNGAAVVNMVNPPLESTQSKVKYSKVKESKELDEATLLPTHPQNSVSKKKFEEPGEAEAVKYFTDATKGTWRPELAKLEAKKFIAFYGSKNWKVGKYKMENWHSAASGWILRTLGEGYSVKDGIVIKSQVDAVTVPQSAEAIAKETEYLYQRFLEGQLKPESIKSHHYQHLKDRGMTDFDDDVKAEIIKQAYQVRVNDLTGTNDGTKNRLRAAYEQNRPRDQEPINGDKVLIGVMKFFGVMQVFQQAAQSGKAILLSQQTNS